MLFLVAGLTLWLIWYEGSHKTVHPGAATTKWPMEGNMFNAAEMKIVEEFDQDAVDCLTPDVADSDGYGLGTLEMSFPKRDE